MLIGGRARRTRGYKAVRDSKLPFLMLQAIKELTNDKGADVVLEMSGASQAIQQSLEAVRPAGRVCALGLPTKPVTLDLSKLIILKDLTFRGIYGRRTWDTWTTTPFPCSPSTRGISVLPRATGSC